MRRIRERNMTIWSRLFGVRQSTKSLLENRSQSEHSQPKQHTYEEVVALLQQLIREANASGVCDLFKVGKDAGNILKDDKLASVQLAKAFRSHNDRGVRHAAAQAFAEVGGAEKESVFTDALADEKADVRGQAARQLGSNAIPALICALEKEEEGHALHFIISAIKTSFIFQKESQAYIPDTMRVARSRLEAFKSGSSVRNMLEKFIENLSQFGRTKETGVSVPSDTRVAARETDLGQVADHPKISQLSPCCSEAEHQWPLEPNAWYRLGAIGTMPVSWPGCIRCGMPIPLFLDCADVQGRQKNDSLRQQMKRRHAVFVDCMKASALAHPDGERPPLEHWIVLGNPDHVLTMPRGPAPIFRPLMRIVGWELWWIGGTDLMRRKYVRGLSLDHYWHGIGMNGDTWWG